jgi:hypothetical protein
LWIGFWQNLSRLLLLNEQREGCPSGFSSTYANTLLFNRLNNLHPVDSISIPASRAVIFRKSRAVSGSREGWRICAAQELNDTQIR